MNLIEHIIEPARLLLVWQVSDTSGKRRTRYLVGELLRDAAGSVSLRYLQESADYQKACDVGFSGYPAFPLREAPYTEQVLETFMRRLPPRSRGDFGMYLESQRLPRDCELSDFALLGYSGAKLPSDWFSLMLPFADIQPPCEFLSEIAGFRYYPHEHADLALGARCTLVPEPDNAFDPDAIQVCLGAHKLGYIGRGHLQALHQWLVDYAITVTIEKILWHTERPRVMVFVRVGR